MSAQLSVPTMVAETTVEGRPRFPSPSATLHNQPTRRMRVPLSSLQNMASEGKIPLTPREIETLQLKGVLRSGLTSSPPTPSTTAPHHIQKSQSSSVTASITPRTTTTTPPSPSSPQISTVDLTTTPSTQPSYTFGSSIAVNMFSKPPLPIAARLAPLISSSKPRSGLPSSPPKTRKRGADSHLAIPYRERQLPSFHEGEIIDTCSHLHDSPIGDDDRTGYRRHSDASAANRPVAEDTRAYDPSRRASIATASPMIPSLLSGRRILYKASPALTLLSLPIPDVPSHTEAMSNFKFPAETSSSTAPLPSPSSPSTLSTGMFPGVGPTTIRSKRKSSIPMRSPSWNEVQDGVIFQLPFGTHTMPSIAPRSGTTNCPSPVIQMATPPSPDSRSGLGIQVEESFTEPGATHPLEASPSNTGSVSRRNAFSDEESTISIGDIIIAEQEASAANRVDTQTVASENQDQSMPTPPMTSRVSSLGVMETENSSESHIDEALVLRTPATPSRHLGSNTTHGNQRNTLTETQEIARGLQESEGRHGSIGSSIGSPTPTSDRVEEQDDDADFLPLWAQRQLSIRRQSAIPRPELDFVSGSGILPPASRGLKTAGGAKILSYPVLISDIVHVVLDDIQAKGGVLDGSDATEESEGDSPEQQTTSSRISKAGLRGGKNGVKRKRGGANHKGRSTKAATNHSHSSPHEDDEQSGDDVMELQDDKSRSSYATALYNKRRRSDTPGQRDQQRQWHQLAPPVELTPIDSSDHARFDEDDDMNVEIEYHGHATDGDDEDYHEEMAVQQRRDGSKGSHKIHNRAQNVPEHLRIPPQEVDLAMQLSREMMETKKRKKQQKDKDGKKKKRLLDEQDHDYDNKATSGMSSQRNKDKGKQAIRNNHSDHSNADAGLRRASLKTLKPLLDATMAVEKGEQKRFDIIGEDYQGDEDMCAPDTVIQEYRVTSNSKYYSGMMMGEMSVSVLGSAGPGSGSSKKVSKANSSALGHSASSSASSTAGPGLNMNGTSSSSAGGPPKKSTKTRESKATTKKCEACGASETPCWRPGYTAHSALCNSCGLRYKKSNVFCPKVGCKYIPLKTEYAAMEAERVKSGRAHLVCHKCKGPVALPIIKE
ncbi:DNA-binding transcription repressor [Linnemannia zychae]|nr:DNA-binding transcription repressor [Linnemannia zychae]